MIFPMRSPTLLILLLGVAILLTGVPPPAFAFDVAKIRQSVVKIYVSVQRENYSQPWQRRGLTSGTGSGFFIGPRRILTNAHVISDARFIEIQRETDSRRYSARVTFIGHDCDLALIEVDDPAFGPDAPPLALGSQLPDLNDEVSVIGYPMGGNRLSITRGVVSRIDHNLYTHSGVDAHLVMQVDAAINPGNSGGPILFKNRVVGLAFQGLLDSQNIGYAIPLPVITHFIDDIADGQYHGYPELGVAWLNTRNPALRKDLGLAPEQGGVVLTYVDPFGSAPPLLQSGDVLLAVEGYRIDEDGTIRINGTPVEFTEILERRQWGASIRFNLWRDGKPLVLDLPLRNPPDPFAFRFLYDTPPPYAVVQGLIFMPISRNLLAGLGSDLGSPETHALFYVSQFAKIDALHSNRTEFVVLTGRLPHPANTYQQNFVNRIVDQVNDRPISSLTDLVQALDHPLRGFHVIRFLADPQPLILDAAEAQKTDREIAATYRIPALRFTGEASP
jgi:S1-C subfamily serine protease